MHSSFESFEAETRPLALIDGRGARKPRASSGRGLRIAYVVAAAVWFVFLGAGLLLR